MTKEQQLFHDNNQLKNVGFIFKRITNFCSVENLYTVVLMQIKAEQKIMIIVVTYSHLFQEKSAFCCYVTNWAMTYSLMFIVYTRNTT